MKKTHKNFDIDPRALAHIDEPGEPGNFIQWKGTDVCIDLYCECGAHHHFDGDFLYSWICGACGQIWEMGDEVSMTKVLPDDLVGIPRELRLTMNCSDEIIPSKHFGDV